MSTSTLLGRRPERSGHIVRELRGRITRGDLRPGVQLPTRLEIAEHFNASSETVQRALEELRRDGYVTVRGRQGTFVSSQPPHLTNYGLVFADGRGRGNRFFRVLNAEAPTVADILGRQINLYFDINRHHDSDDFKSLVADVKAHRVGGLIFTSIPWQVEDTPILSEPGIPRVAVMSATARFGIPTVCTDGDHLWQRAGEYLLGRGRKRLGVISPALNPQYVESVRAQFVAQGFQCPSKWWQCAQGTEAWPIRNLMELLFTSPGERPDALILSDDNSVEHALAGLVAAGARVPEDVEVVTHCNFPHPVPSILPVRQLGFDSHLVLSTCIDVLDRLRAGQEVPAATRIPAQFEEELVPLKIDT